MEVRSQDRVTISVFVASSVELEEDRVRLYNLISSLNDYYDSKGVFISTYLWENGSSKYNGRKQDEYNAEISRTDIFIGLFWTKAGEFTKEEFDVACHEYQVRKLPAIYIYFKDSDLIEVSLQDFKDFVYNKGHFAARYSSSEKLLLDFLLEWVKFNPVISIDNIKIRDSKVCIDNGPELLSFSQLSFADKNQEYAELCKKVKKKQERLLKYPDDEEYREELMALEQEKNKLENTLFDIAKTISSFDRQNISERLSRAIELFESGDAAGANSLLSIDTLDQSFTTAVGKRRQLAALIEEQNKTVEQVLEEYLLKIRTLTHLHQPGWEDEVFHIFDMIIENRGSIAQERFVELMISFALYCDRYQFYGKSIYLLEKLDETEISEDYLTSILSLKSKLYLLVGEYQKAYDCFEATLDMFKKLLSQPMVKVQTLYEIDSFIDRMVSSEYYLHVITDEDSEERIETLKELISFIDNYIGYVLDLKDFTDNEELLVTLYINLATLYGRINDYEECDRCYDKALSLVGKVENRFQHLRENIIASKLISFASNENYDGYFRAEYPKLETFYRDLYRANPNGDMHNFLGILSAAQTYFERVGDIKRLIDVIQESIDIIQATRGEVYQYNVSNLGHCYLALCGAYRLDGDVANLNKTKAILRDLMLQTKSQQVAKQYLSVVVHEYVESRGQILSYDDACEVYLTWSFIPDSFRKQVFLVITDAMTELIEHAKQERDFEKVEEYLDFLIEQHLSFDDWEDINNYAFMGFLLNELATACEETGKYDKQLKALENSIKCFERIPELDEFYQSTYAASLNNYAFFRSESENLDVGGLNRLLAIVNKALSLVWDDAILDTRQQIINKINELN